MGPKEAFILSRLDGTRSPVEIGEEYAEEFGKRLGDEHWARIFTLLGNRRLLAGMEDAEPPAAPARPARTVLKARWPLVDPDRLLSGMERRLRWIFSPLLILPLSAVLVMLLSWVATRVPTLYAEATGAWHTPMMVAVFAVSWGTLALHELAHGLTCKHFGGHAPEIGVIWRFPLLAPYCKADDMVLFERRGARVLTSFAGIFTSLLVLVPMWAVYPLLPHGNEVRGAIASVLLFGSATTLLNLVPFLQLDGYFMLNHALGMVNLREESYRYLLMEAKAMLRRGQRIDYPRRTRLIYLAYGLSSVLFGLGLAAALLTSWFSVLSGYVGGLSAALILGAEAGVVVLVMRYLRSRRMRDRRPPAE
ncbi:M50 family metallopeptidase [Nonomuraea sp. NPDC048881]|uniref:M50 family metallopeptidase n=1 Tax=Nonomuraea sp. NPDC048881 TaxID=3155030 RepID=UPI003410B5EA